MNTTSAKLLLSIILLGVLVSACNHNDPSGENPLPLDLGADTRGFVEANNQFAVTTFLDVRETAPDRDNMICTYGAFAIFSTLANGADEDGRTIVLGELGASDAALLNDFIHSSAAQLPYLDSKASFRSIDYVWIKPTYSVSRSFSETAARMTNPHFGILDLYGQNDKEFMNWTIKGVCACPYWALLESDVDIYWDNYTGFAAPLKNPFDKSKTKECEFLNIDGTKAKVNMMFQQAQLYYGEHDGWRSVSLPLGNGGFTFTAFLPPNNEALSTITADIIGKCMEYRKCLTVSLGFPHLNIGNLTHWNGKQLQIADYPSIPSPEAQYDRLLENHVLEGVDITSVAAWQLYEEGINQSVKGRQKESGKATSPDTAIVFDRPCLFTVSEESTGLILFIGQMARGLEGY